MFKKMRKIILIFIALTSAAFAQQDMFLSMGTIKARPIAMGGAYTSIQDNIVSAAYNPATLNLYRSEKKFRITLFLNPIAPTALLYDQYKTRDQFGSNDERNYRAIKNSALLIKGIVLTAKFLDLALVFNEQIIDENMLSSQKKVFQDVDLWNNCYHSVITRLKLADRVSLGASASMYVKRMGNRVERDYGFSYGILLKPSMKMNVGIAYLYFPQAMPDIRMPLERMVDQTMNVGISYRPTRSTTLSLDLRNLTEEERKTTREVHLGFEQRIFSILAIRGGIYQERFTNNKMITAGLALIDSNVLFSRENQFSQPQFMLNYSLAYKKEAEQIFRWHVISLMIRI